MYFSASSGLPMPPRFNAFLMPRFSEMFLHGFAQHFHRFGGGILLWLCRSEVFTKSAPPRIAAAAARRHQFGCAQFAIFESLSRVLAHILADMGHLLKQVFRHVFTAGSTAVRSRNQFHRQASSINRTSATFICGSNCPCRNAPATRHHLDARTGQASLLCAANLYGNCTRRRVMAIYAARTLPVQKWRYVGFVVPVRF